MKLFLGSTPISKQQRKAHGEFVTIDGESYYKITDFEQLPPFFITLTSAADLFMYLGCGGALTCGRGTPDKALFPYDTDDKIVRNGGRVGPVAAFRISVDRNNYYLWQPFSDASAGVYDIERSVAKSLIGNKIIFIEENKCLGVRFAYSWSGSNEYGWVRKSRLENISSNNSSLIFLSVKNML